MGNTIKNTFIQTAGPGLLLLCLLWPAGPAVAHDRQVILTSVAKDMAKGPDALLLQAAAQRLGFGIRFRLAPFKRRLIMIKNGDIDMTCGLLRRPERESYIYYVTPPYKTRSDTLFFVRQDRAGQIQSCQDLKGLKIGVNRGSRYFHRFDRDTTLIKEAAQPVNNFNKLLLGRVDAVIYNEASGLFFIHTLGVADQIAISPFRFSQEKKVYFGISMKSWMIDSLDRIQPVLESFIRSGQARSIIKRYYTKNRLPVPAM